MLRFHLPAWPLLMLAVAPCATAMAQTHDMSHMDMAGPVGSVHFGNSCTHAVGAQLDHAVASLYSFWFIDARERFQRVAQQDPDCAIAYWGVAMSNYEQISGGGLPEGRQLKAGRDALVNAKPAREFQTIHGSRHLNIGENQVDLATGFQQSHRLIRHRAFRDREDSVWMTGVQ